MAKRRSSKKITRNIPFRVPSPLVIVFAFVVGLGLGLTYQDYFLLPPSSNLEHNQIRACFTPGGYCEANVIAVVDAAKSEILVQTYSFTSEPIKNALIKAHSRGVRVVVLFDVSASKGRHSKVRDLKRAGIITIPEKVKGLAHNKVMIVDQTVVITGSYNWTNAARDRNAENLLIINDPKLAGQYIANFKRLSAR